MLKMTEKFKTYIEIEKRLSAWLATAPFDEKAKAILKYYASCSAALIMKNESYENYKLLMDSVIALLDVQNADIFTDLVKYGRNFGDDELGRMLDSFVGSFIMIKNTPQRIIDDNKTSFSPAPQFIVDGMADELAIWQAKTQNEVAQILKS